MRKVAILSIFVLMLALVAYGAAADVVVTSSFDEDHPTFGGDEHS